MNLGDTMCFVHSWSAKGSEKSLEVRSKSLEIGSVRSYGIQGLPSMFEPHVIPPGPCQQDQHACWCPVWRRQIPSPGSRKSALWFCSLLGSEWTRNGIQARKLWQSPSAQSTEIPNNFASAPNPATELCVCSQGLSTGFYVVSSHCLETEVLLDQQFSTCGS